MTIIQ